jgi:phosphatidylserine decarboxylase
LFLLAIPAAVVAPAVGGALLVLGAFVVWFHRDPERTPPATGVVSPADGRVSVVRE